LLNPTSLKRYKNVYISCIYTVHWNQVSSRCTCSVYDPYSVINIIEFSQIISTLTNINIQCIWIVLMTEYGSYTRQVHLLDTWFQCTVYMQLL
jgi:hypothetical protein